MALKRKVPVYLIPGQHRTRPQGENYDKLLEELPEEFLDIPEELLRALEEASSETGSETVPETFPMDENDRLPGLDEEREPIQDTSKHPEPREYSGSAAGQRAKTAGNDDPIKFFLLASVAVLAVLLLAAVVGYIVMYQLQKRHMRTQEDKEATEQDWDSSWESCGLPSGEEESGEGPGSSERAPAKRFRDSCRLFPEVFAAELSRLYKNVSADPSPLPTCSFCALADGASSRDHWISMESPQPTESWCPCCHYQQEYFLLEDDD